MTPVYPPTATSRVAPRLTFREKINRFWLRVTEGLALNQLWSQFEKDARASYRLYAKDLEAKQDEIERPGRRFIHVAQQFFWAVLEKLTPARRLLLLIALVFLIFNPQVDWHDQSGNMHIVSFDFRLYGGLLLLLILILEVGDRVVMKRDLEIAREIQSWLVPSQPPEVPGADIAFATRPQNSVAGDYYDAFYPTASAADGGKLMLVIADVAGKSVPAALLMATLQASLRTVAGEEAPLADLVARLNRYACAHSADGRRFTTAVLGLYDPAERRLAYVNAGHNAPVLRRANGTLEQLDTGGLPLGIESGAVYETATVELPAGDALIFFTDGVVEAFNEAGEEFGNRRWLTAIRGLPAYTAQESLQHLMKGVDEFVGATRQSDDITCMIFRSR